jgi:hypothetical protein
MQPTNSHNMRSTFHTEPGDIEGQLKKTLRFDIHFLHANLYDILLHSWSMLIRTWRECLYNSSCLRDKSGNLVEGNKTYVGGHLVPGFWKSLSTLFWWSLGWLCFHSYQNWTKTCKLINIHILQTFQDLSIGMFANIADSCDPHTCASCDSQNIL